MDRERITISIKKKVLDKIDRTIDGAAVRNRSHAIETLTLKGLGKDNTSNAIVLLGGDDALKSVPAIKSILPELKKAGFEKITVAIGFLGDKVKEKLGDGKEFGLSLTYSDKGEGSGGAVLSQKKNLDNTFLVINHPHFESISLSSLLDFHKKHQFVATIATDNLDDYEGIYVFDTEVLNIIPKGFSMLEEDVIPKLVKESKAAVCPVIK